MQLIKQNGEQTEPAGGNNGIIHTLPPPPPEYDIAMLTGYSSLMVNLLVNLPVIYQK